MKIKQILLSIVLSVTLLIQVYANSYQDMNNYISQLNVGSTNLDLIIDLFGQPENKTEIMLYYEYIDGKEKKYFETARQANIYGAKEEIKRTLYKVSYDKVGVAFSLFDNPWQLYDISIKKEGVIIEGIQVGDNLSTLQNKLGKGSWETSEGSDIWWYVYQDKGVRYGFMRDKQVQPYPIKLAMPKTIVGIEVFDKYTVFLGA